MNDTFNFITKAQVKAAVGDRDRTVELLAGLVEDLGAAIALLSLTDRVNAEFLALAINRVASRNAEVREAIAKIEGVIQHGDH